MLMVKITNSYIFITKHTVLIFSFEAGSTDMSRPILITPDTDDICKPGVISVLIALYAEMYIFDTVVAIV